MADPLYPTELFLDSPLIKQEPLTDSVCVTSASVPIPSRRGLGLPEYFEDSSYQAQEATSLQDTSIYWGGDQIDDDDDDIFKVVDKADLIQGPTLAELNANDENLLGDLNFDGLLLPEEGSNSYNASLMSSSKLNLMSLNPAVQVQVNTHSSLSAASPAGSGFLPSSFPPGGSAYYRDPFSVSSSVPSSPMDPFLYNSGSGNATGLYQNALSPASQHSSNSSLIPHSVDSRSPVTPPPQPLSPLQQKQGTLHELLLRKGTLSASPDRRVLGQSVPGPNSPLANSGPSVSNVQTRRSGGAMLASSAPSPVSRLSSSAPTHLGFDHVWQRREPRQHLLSTGSLAEAGSTSSLSTGGILSPVSYEFSDSEDSDHYEDMSSDGESSDVDNCNPHSRSQHKRERYFWQYNVQAKGPKGQRLIVKTELEDPYHLNRVTDPVFSPQCSVQGIKHSGKARKGDGNDLTPNPRKLHNIGRELDKLGRIINDMTPVSELPFNVRPKTRKEKNKLASRACRLKKKAQHEANKIKLYGLENEHKRLLHAIQIIRQTLARRVNGNNSDSHDLSSQIDEIIRHASRIKIAGETTDFVNTVLEKFKNGIPEGGLKDVGG